MKSLSFCFLFFVEYYRKLSILKTRLAEHCELGAKGAEVTNFLRATSGLLLALLFFSLFLIFSRIFTQIFDFNRPFYTFLCEFPLFSCKYLQILANNCLFLHCQQCYSQKSITDYSRFLQQYKNHSLRKKNMP